ncbi:TPA: hypothetical protein KOX39_003447 [Clostridioides difficile]|nr:hypothetical protein [Clostridioides difficile]
MRVNVPKDKIQKEIPSGYSLGSIIVTDKAMYQVVCIGTPKRQITPFDYLLLSIDHGYLLRFSATHDYAYLPQYIENNLKEKVIGFIHSKDVEITHKG